MRIKYFKLDFECSILTDDLFQFWNHEQKIHFEYCEFFERCSTIRAGHAHASPSLIRNSSFVGRYFHVAQLY